MKLIVTTYITNHISTCVCNSNHSNKHKPRFWDITVTTDIKKKEKNCVNYHNFCVYKISNY